MPRTARFIPPGVLVHIRCRFVDGRFELDDQARHRYLEQLDDALADADWTLLSYALMSSHIHLGAISGHLPLHTWIHPLNTAIAGWLSARRRSRSPRALGPVFGDRPGTNLLPMGRALPLLSYHHNNPVDAGVVGAARQSHWTSHPQYLGRERHHVAALDVAKGLDLCAMSASEFDAAVDQLAHRQTLVEGTPMSIVMNVSRHLGVPLRDVRGGSRTRPAVAARRICIAVGAAWGHPCAHMAAALGISKAAGARLASTADDAVAVAVAELTREWRVAV